ncbi:hypothetical protein M901_0675, partial [Bacteriovorax sp. DB6_IX]
MNKHTWRENEKNLYDITGTFSSSDFAKDYWLLCPFFH